MRTPPSGRLEFVSLELVEHEQSESVILVTLRSGGDRTVSGESASRTARTPLRGAALAATEAVNSAVAGSGTRFEVKGVRAVMAFEATVVVVTLEMPTASGARHLVGSCCAENDVPRGAALAVLNATNRYVEGVVAHG